MLRRMLTIGLYSATIGIGAGLAIAREGEAAEPWKWCAETDSAGKCVTCHIDTLCGVGPVCCRINPE